MAPILDSKGSDSAVAFLVSLDVAYTVISATNSSPQTTEINAVARADTLMKWVAIGLVQIAGIALIAALIERAQGRPTWPVLFGSALGGGLMFAQYAHARAAGLEQVGPPTENYTEQFVPATAPGW